MAENKTKKHLIFSLDRKKKIKIPCLRNPAGFCVICVNGIAHFSRLSHVRDSPGARARHAVRAEDEVQVDAEDRDAEQRHQADALPGPSEVLSLPPAHPGPTMLLLLLPLCLLLESNNKN